MAEALEYHLEHQSSRKAIHLKDHHISKEEDLKTLAHPKKGHILEAILERSRHHHKEKIYRTLPPLKLIEAS